MIKVELTVKRTNGQIEVVDATDKFPGINKQLFDAIKEQTAKAGRGEVISATKTTVRNNLKDIARRYNDLHNEGGDGYIPYEQLAKSEEYREWSETEVIK